MIGDEEAYRILEGLDWNDRFEAPISESDHDVRDHVQSSEIDSENNAVKVDVVNFSTVLEEIRRVDALSPSELALEQDLWIESKGHEEDTEAENISQRKLAITLPTQELHKWVRDSAWEHSDESTLMRKELELDEFLAIERLRLEQSLLAELDGRAKSERKDG